MSSTSTEDPRKPFRAAKRFIGAVGAFLTSLCLIGGNLFLLQLAAWSWMIASYSAEDGLGSAIRDTFGGDRPCQLCTAIAETRNEAEDSPGEATLAEREPLKLITADTPILAIIPPSGRTMRPAPAVLPFPTIPAEPESPPPRV